MEKRGVVEPGRTILEAAEEKQASATALENDAVKRLVEHAAKVTCKTR